MNNDDLILRQQRLLIRSAELRIAFSNQVQIIKSPLGIADQAQAGLQWLYRNPQWPLGALLLIVVLRPQAALRWGGRLWWAWNAYRKTRSLLAARPLSEISIKS
jgi:hypothetical protein